MTSYHICECNLPKEILKRYHYIPVAYSIDKNAYYYCSSARLYLILNLTGEDAVYLTLTSHYILPISINDMSEFLSRKTKIIISALEQSV